MPKVIRCVWNMLVAMHTGKARNQGNSFSLEIIQVKNF